MKTKPASSVTLLCFYPAALALVELLPAAANRAVGSLWIKGRQQLHLPRTSMCVWAHGCDLPKTVRNGTCMCKLMELFYRNILCTPVPSSFVSSSPVSVAAEHTEALRVRAETRGEQPLSRSQEGSARAGPGAAACVRARCSAVVGVYTERSG